MNIRAWLLVVTIFKGSLACASPRLVNFTPPAHLAVGSVYVNTSEKALYLILDNQQAIRYPVAVGKAGRAWSGYAYISSKRYRPDWSPPPAVRADHPELPHLIPGGSPQNPMGEAALLLGDGEYAIHGTTIKMRNSIGRAASYGCIRMYNEDILELFGRVGTGAVVLVGR